MIIKWLATILKEWRLLVRDRTGLLLLFVMPAALVVVITLVQDNVLRQTGAMRIAGVVVDQDGAEAGQAIMAELEASEVLNCTRTINGQPADETQARRWVENGKAQFYALIPPGLSSAMEKSTRGRMEHLVTAAKEASEPPPSATPQVHIYFDPTLTHLYRATVNGAMQRAAAKMQGRYSMQLLGEALENNLRRRMAQIAGPFAARLPEQLIPPLDNAITDDTAVSIATHAMGADPYAHMPSAVQQNVPAWALFGIFFIVVPLSGSLIIERREGILARLMTMPVSITALILGKLSAYVGVCLVQFLCIVMVGKWLLPALGTDALVLDRQLAAIGLVALCSILAATGYGVLLGALARTNQQAGILGPVSVVIAAALGGIMVPVFAMPPVMQSISRISPLAWAHEAFMILMVREGNLADAWGNLLLLLLFFVITLMAALMALRRQGR